MDNTESPAVVAILENKWPFFNDYTLLFNDRTRLPVENEYDENTLKIILHYLNKVSDQI